MRFLSSARIVVLDADPDHRAYLCAALSGLGMSQVLPAGSVDEARRLATPIPVDLCVVDPRRLPGPIAAAANRIPPNPLDPSRTPAILIADDATRETIRAAAASGYSAVLEHPVVPRLLYRRIGSALQKARRVDRLNDPKIVTDSNVIGTGLQER